MVKCKECWKEITGKVYHISKKFMSPPSNNNFHKKCMKPYIDNLSEQFEEESRQFRDYESHPGPFNDMLESYTPRPKFKKTVRRS